MRRSKPLLSLLLFLASFLPAQGRGGYFNQESPQVSPLALIDFRGKDWLLVCNTPASLLELWDPRRFLRIAAVPVGLEPVSVTGVRRGGLVVTANMLGDSLSLLRLVPDGKGGMKLVFLKTAWVGDEPMDVAFAPDGASLFVSLNGSSAFAWLKLPDLAPAIPGFSEKIPCLDRYDRPSMALAKPRRILVDRGRLFLLGFSGGHSWAHDLDLWSLDFSNPVPVVTGGLGTTKTAMAFASNGDLWVTACEARNDLVGEAKVAAAKSGFVRSLLHRIRSPGGRNPKVETRDLNLDPTGAPVKKADSLAHPFALALEEKGGAVRKVFVAAFNRDRIGVVVPGTGGPSSWTVRGFPVPRYPGSPNPMAGPRGLVFKPARPGIPRDPGARLYILNRLDNSLAVADPVGEKVLAVRPLSANPTPSYIRKGRRFLYDASLSGNGFVSCASCHVDGRTDGLAWDLSGSPGAPPSPLDRNLIDGVTDVRVRNLKGYPSVKGRKTTQSLLGLVRGEMEGPGQEWFTSYPLHWRGDRPGFEDFNPAFVSLMGMPNLGSPGRPRGLSPRDMKSFETFVNSLRLPPNPEERPDRRFGGSLGIPGKEDGSGALRGLKLFHERPMRDPKTGRADPRTAGRSCVQCHALPTGSNLRLTAFGLASPQILKTPRLRGAGRKEARLEPSIPSSPIAKGEAGLGDSGSFPSIEEFNRLVFAHNFAPGERDKVEDLNALVRQWDSGTAPAVGLAWTVTTANRNRKSTAALADLLESQVREGSLGLAAHLFTGGRVEGYWFDPGAGQYAREPGGARISRNGLFLRLKGAADRLVLQGTPLGSERRIASPTGRPGKGRPSKVTSIELLPMRPLPLWEPVLRLRKNWVPGPRSNPTAFAWEGVYSGTLLSVPEPPSLKTLRLLQYGWIRDGGGKASRGLRHEAPLRLRVAARGILPGARLILIVPMDPHTPPPYKVPRPAMPLVFRLHPTGDRLSGGRRVWVCDVEIPPVLAHVLALGGPAAPGVRAALQAKLPEPPAKGTFRPKTWNRHWVWIVQEAGDIYDGGWQALRF